MNIWYELEELERKYNNYEITIKQYFDLKAKICDKYINKNKVLGKKEEK